MDSERQNRTGEDGQSPSRNIKPATQASFRRGQKIKVRSSGSGEAGERRKKEMRLYKLYDRYDREVFIDLDHKPEPQLEKSLLTYFDRWMDSSVKWGSSFLLICGAVTFISVLIMILKHV